MSLIDELFELKGIDIINYEDKEKFIKLHEDFSEEEKLYKIKRLFYYNIYTCGDIYILIKWLTEDYEEEKSFFDEETVLVWIRNFNEYVDELDEYLSYKKVVDEIGYKNLHSEYLEKIKNLCKEMLDYKNKPYDDDIRLQDLFNKIELYYAYYSYQIYLLRIALIGLAPGVNIEECDKHLDNVEEYMLVKSYYEYLKNNYKEKAFIYRDFDLKEGETTTDLHMKEMEKFNNLYKEMLDFIHVKYNDDDIPHKIECLVNLLKLFPHDVEPFYAGFGNNLVMVSLSKYNYAEYDDYGNPVKYTIRKVFDCELSEYFGQFVSQMVEELETIMKGEEQ